MDDSHDPEYYQQAGESAAAAAPSAFLDPVLGQEGAYDRLLLAAYCGQMHHALLIEGERGLGKTLIAMTIAQALLCPQRNAAGACGVCPACKKVALHNHPDLHEVGLPEEKQEIPVELVRNLQGELAKRPLEEVARVVILDPADRLNAQGQNALLKTLEEPNPDTFLLLVSSRPEGLLDTVRSRVGRLRVLPLAEDALRRGVKGVRDQALLNWALGRSRGSLGLARRLADPKVKGLDERVARYLEDPDDPAAVTRDLLAGCQGRQATEEQARLVLALLREQFRERIQRLHGKGDVALDAPAAASYSQPIGPLADALDAVFRAEEDLGLKISVAQVLQALFLQFATER